MHRAAEMASRDPSNADVKGLPCHTSRLPTKEKLTSERSEQQKLEELLEALTEPILRIDFRVADLHGNLLGESLRAFD